MGFDLSAVVAAGMMVRTGGGRDRHKARKKKEEPYEMTLFVLMLLWLIYIRAYGPSGECPPGGGCGRSLSVALD